MPKTDLLYTRQYWLCILKCCFITSNKNIITCNSNSYYLHKRADDVRAKINQLYLTEEDIEQSGLVAPIVGHAGDGNFHVLILLDVDNPVEIEVAESFVARLNARALGMDGTCAGEHGIGQGKRGFLREELGGAVDVMKAVKLALDPVGIMNPGKVFL